LFSVFEVCLSSFEIRLSPFSVFFAFIFKEFVDFFSQSPLNAYIYHVLKISDK
jgi:hypothetical protein